MFGIGAAFALTKPSFFQIVVNRCPWTQMAPTTYHIEVDRCFPKGPFRDLGIVRLVRLLVHKELRYSNHESGWQMEKCLRQGFGRDWLWSNMPFPSLFEWFRDDAPGCHVVNVFFFAFFRQAWRLTLLWTKRFRIFRMYPALAWRRSEGPDLNFSTALNHSISIWKL